VGLRRRAGLLPAAAASLVIGFAPAAEAITRCASPQDQAMFEVAALKTELMVVGITCKQEESYNAFVLRYRPQLIDNDRAVTAYFNRLRGRGGQRAADIFITNLAQARGIAGQRLGTDFCPRNGGLFAEVMSLPGGSDLQAYAAGKDVIPADLPGCEPAPPPARPAAAAARRSRAQ
jgi:hypothetical protein